MDIYYNTCYSIHASQERIGRTTTDKRGENKMKNKMELITVSKIELAELLVNAEHGSTDYDICYNTDTKNIDNRHTTQQWGPWVVLIDLYNTTYDNVETWSDGDWLEFLREIGSGSIKKKKRYAPVDKFSLP